MKKINKRTAEKLYNQGIEVFIIPCKLNPNSKWGLLHEVPAHVDFNKFLNEYMYYNCSNETGKYPHFYIAGN